MKNQTIQALRRFLEDQGPQGAWLIQTESGWEMGVRLGEYEESTLALPDAIVAELSLLENLVAGFLADVQRVALRQSLGLRTGLPELEVELEELPAFESGETQAQRIDPELAMRWRLMQDEGDDVYHRSTSLVDTDELTRRLRAQRATMASPTMQLHTTPATRLAELTPHLVRRGGRAYRDGARVILELPGVMGSTHQTAYSLEDFLRLPVPELLARALEEVGALPKRT